MILFILIFFLSLVSFLLLLLLSLLLMLLLLYFVNSFAAQKCICWCCFRCVCVSVLARCGLFALHVLPPLIHIIIAKKKFCALVLIHHEAYFRCAWYNFSILSLNDRSHDFRKNQRRQIHAAAQKKKNEILKRNR